jgi:hypothetical protein
MEYVIELALRTGIVPHMNIRNVLPLLRLILCRLPPPGAVPEVFDTTAPLSSTSVSFSAEQKHTCRISCTAYPRILV